MLTNALIVIALAVAGLLVFAATRPDEMRVVRDATVAAPADRIYPHLADFKAWRAWSPWENRDPNLERTLDGAPSGVGAHYAWKGNKEVGQGEMHLTAATPPTRVEIALHFIAPWEAQNRVVFDLAPEGAGTRVTWTMTGKANFMFKLMGIFMNMDRMIGKDFEQGLANLKTVAEKPAG